MRNMKSIPLALCLLGALLTAACTETCKWCDTQGRAGVTVRIVDGDDVVHDFTTGENGCVTFDADDCGQWMVVDMVAPVISMV
jgi:hypothetical protein